MTRSQRIVIVGGGVAAGKAVNRLRDRGWDGELTVVADEPHPPYARPPLSKDLLVNTETREDSTYLKPRSWYADQGIDLRTSVHVDDVDVIGSVVETSDGPIPFDQLLLATGSRPRPLPPSIIKHTPGQSLTYLRTIEDSLRIRSQLSPGAKILLIGGGWIAMEIAASARAAGCSVTVLERGSLPLARALGQRVAERFTDLHRSHGVEIRTGAVVTDVDAGDDGARVVLEGGVPLTADLVVVGIGAEPNTELAESAGLAISNGILADEFLRTSTPTVFAAGDVANAYHPRYGGHQRVEHWHNAVHQGEVVADNMIGAPVAYDQTPYFYTDQFEFGMEFMGYLDPGSHHETIIRGDLASASFIAFWTSRGRIAAAMHVNDWDAMTTLRDLVEAGPSVSDLPNLANKGVDLEALASTIGRR